MVRDPIDPILARREQQRRQLLDISADNNVTFREATEAFIRAHEPQWRNRKHVQQWGNTLKTYAYPVIGDARVRDIDTAMIVRILQPIWTKKAETARRVRGRIKAILDAETVLGHRVGSNPPAHGQFLAIVPRAADRFAYRFVTVLWRSCTTHCQRQDTDICSLAARKGNASRTSANVECDAARMRSRSQNCGIGRSRTALVLDRVRMARTRRYSTRLRDQRHV
ncbi:phage integrase central domain-containing protein [Paraburkholderia heleia]|uniref:phage integrase central domain-containing protein n=1 Tax=Paraburkholderia heleia TaxID=634127 RepID=UPI002AB64BBA|nr:hypothetical protein [Paraburkholderia heleia]